MHCHECVQNRTNQQAAIVELLDFSGARSQSRRLMTSPNSLFPIARGAQHLARSTGARDSLLFQKVAAVAMCMVAVASGMHVLKELYRTLYPEHRHQGRSR